MDFYKIDNKLKAQKKEQAKKLSRVAAGVDYGNPDCLLDADQCIKLAWDAISNAII